jgi:hypothetical protein
MEDILETINLLFYLIDRALKPILYQVNVFNRTPVPVEDAFWKCFLLLDKDHFFKNAIGRYA